MPKPPFTPATATAWGGRASPKALRATYPLVQALFDLGRTSSLTLAQLSLAWLLTRPERVVAFRTLPRRRTSTKT